MDTEYDRAVLKVLVAGNLSKKECSSVGLDIENVKKNIAHIKVVIQENENALIAADDLFNLRMEEKLSKNEEALEKTKRKILTLGPTLSNHRKEELEEKMNVLKQKKADNESLLMDPVHEKKRTKAMKRIKLAILEENRVKRRHKGAGPHPKLLGDDEDFISQCIEDHAAVDGRRKEGVLYYARRLKKKDLLTITNYHLLQSGRAAIKSATTITNRARPKNIRSIQAKRNHRGKWLFCSKKPPKTALCEKIHTRHQRQARKLAKYHAWTNSKCSADHFLVISKDDKAYLRPGTTGK